MRSTVKLKRRRSEWHHWFAWRPVRVPAGNVMYAWVWWEYVERKLTYSYCQTTAEYRLLPRLEKRFW